MSDAALSERQKEVVYLLSIGKENRDIAELMGICRMTVTRHLQRAKDATGCATTIGLVGYALRKGLIQ